MIAVGLYHNINVELADKYVKSVIKNAIYQKIYDNYTMALYPCDNTEHDAYRYVVNGKAYTSIYTNKHSDLVKMYQDDKQMTIFDFIGENNEIQK